MRLTHKFLDIDNHQIISDEIYNFVSNHTDLLNSEEKFCFHDVDVANTLKHTPLLQKFLKEKLLQPTMIGIVVTHADSPSNLHADFVNILTATYIRILWPVKNCHGSRTVFYDVPKEHLKVVDQPNGKKYYSVPTDQDWAYLNEFELSSPVVFDTIVPHEVVPAPNSTDHRISCSIGFNKDLLLSKSFDAWNKF
jgi:hypothetical protein